MHKLHYNEGSENNQQTLAGKFNNHEMMRMMMMKIMMMRLHTLWFMGREIISSLIDGVWFRRCPTCTQILIAHYNANRKTCLISLSTKHSQISPSILVPNLTRCEP